MDRGARWLGLSPSALRARSLRSPPKIALAILSTTQPSLRTYLLSFCQWTGERVGSGYRPRPCGPAHFVRRPKSPCDFVDHSAISPYLLTVILPMDRGARWLGLSPSALRARSLRSPPKIALRFCRPLSHLSVLTYCHSANGPGSALARAVALGPAGPLTSFAAQNRLAILSTTQPSLRSWFSR